MDPQRVPIHDDIAQCARDLWVVYGRPEGRDLEIWLEAEKRLQSATQTRRETPGSAPSPVTAGARPQGKQSHEHR